MQMVMNAGSQKQWQAHRQASGTRMVNLCVWVCNYARSSATRRWKESFVQELAGIRREMCNYCPSGPSCVEHSEVVCKQRRRRQAPCKLQFSSASLHRHTIQEKSKRHFGENNSSVHLQKWRWWTNGSGTGNAAFERTVIT